MADPNTVKSKRCSNPSRKVRVIGKIRGGLTDGETESLVGQDLKPWITVKKTQGNDLSQKSSLLLETQSTSRKDEFELDYCYEQNEEVGRIYSREIQPLVLDVFNGRNASVIALGARGSGKTYTIQGSQEKPGLAVIAMSEILSKAKQLGKSVSVSLYELTHEYVKDLLHPDHPAIHVLEDARGKINLKGLSQVSVNSITGFHDIYFGQSRSQNNHKIPMDQPRNKGLMVHVSAEDDKQKAKIENKINFVDLAGYEDPRKNSKDRITSAESYRNNRLLYALLNVVSAINNNEIRVPYRESKLTKILQDSLGGTSHVLILTCLNPYFCQDSLSFLRLVSRSCQNTNQVLTDSTNRSQSSTKVKVPSSLESGKSMSGSLSALRQNGHSQLLSGKKNGSILKGRKLFDEAKIAKPNQLSCKVEDNSVQKSKNILQNLAVVAAPLSLEEAPQDKSISEYSPEEEPIEFIEGCGAESIADLQKATLSNVDDDKLMTTMEKDTSPHSGAYYQEATHATNSVAIVQMPAASTCEGSNGLYKKDDGSPPLSERIRKISNNLKSLCESTPLTITVPEQVGTTYSTEVGYSDIGEPKTPAMEHSSARYCSPRCTFSNRSTGVKNTIVQDHLNFLNSANKEELKSLKGIRDKRAKYILELREESPEPFKNLDDLQDIGLSAKQIKGMMKHAAAELFN